MMAFKTDYVQQSINSVEAKLKWVVKVIGRRIYGIDLVLFVREAEINYKAWFSRSTSSDLKRGLR